MIVLDFFIISLWIIFTIRLSSLYKKLKSDETMFSEHVFLCLIYLILSIWLIHVFAKFILLYEHILYIKVV